jgi:hypothetical protein
MVVVGGARVKGAGYRAGVVKVIFDLPLRRPIEFKLKIKLAFLFIISRTCLVETLLGGNSLSSIMATLRLRQFPPKRVSTYLKSNPYYSFLNFLAVETL